jgi:non-ribosomal peptide synthetase component F
VREVCLEAYDHQETPYLLLVGLARPDVVDTSAPLFNVVFNVQNTPRPTAALAGLAIESRELGNGSARYDLAWSVVVGDNTWQVVVEYRRARFKAPIVASWCASWATLLSRLAVGAEEKLIE